MHVKVWESSDRLSVEVGLFAGDSKIRHTPSKNVKTQLSYGVVNFTRGMKAIPSSS
jgi:hypothetical protein